jgi:hypothetical protein
LVLLAFALIAASVIWLSNPAQVQAGLAGGGGPRGSAAVAFALVIGFYIVVAQAQAVVLAGLYAWRATGAASRWGFGVLAAGLSLQVAQTGGKAVAVALSAIGGGWSPGLLRIYLGVVELRPPSYVLMWAGAGLSGAASLTAALPVWRAHRRDYRRLQPLRKLLYEAFPEHALDPVTAVWRDVLLPRRVHWRFYRRLIEVLDGLDQLRPFYDRTVAASLSPRVATCTDEDCVLAAVIAEATRTHIRITRVAEVAARGAGLAGTRCEDAVHHALVAEAARRDAAGLVFHGIDQIGDGTIEQVTPRLVRVAEVLSRALRPGQQVVESGVAATPATGHQGPTPPRSV